MVNAKFVLTPPVLAVTLNGPASKFAVNAGAVASHHAAGVIVYQMQGEPEFDVWSDPKVIARYGMTPEPI